MTVDQEYAHAIADYLADRGFEISADDAGFDYFVTPGYCFRVREGICNAIVLGERPDWDSYFDLSDPTSLDQIEQFFRSNS